MRHVLHILTKPDDELAANLIASQRQETDQAVIVVDLTKPEADYRALLEEIFAADSIHVW